MPMRAGSGTSCADPIVLSDGYSAYFSGARTVWYIANTFDLPLAMDFYPNNPNDPAPELDLDFGCTPGTYEDSILCSLFCWENGSYISMPYHDVASADYDGQGQKYYHVEFGEFYRDLLLERGIDYNVQVYVKATFSGSGSLTMAPDPFNNCMDGHKFMHLGDTVQVQANDADRHVVVPYVQWQYDSIRYVWSGTEPCLIAIGNKCGFDPTDALDGTIMDGGVVQPGGEFRVSSALLMQYVMDQTNYPNDAGMYFAKFYSTAPGVMKIEKIPAPAPQGEAVLLKYGEETNIGRKDTTTVYAIPDSWIKAMQFTTPTDRVFKMYIGQTPDFYTTNAVVTYQFDRTEDGHQLSLLASDMTSIWQHKLASEHYLYIRFECSDNTTVLPTLWTPSACMTKAKRIEPGVQFEVSAKSKAIYSLYYADWVGGDMNIAWSVQQSACTFYIADTCDVQTSIGAHTFYSDVAKKATPGSCPMATVDSWESRVDPDGYLYFLFYSQAKGKITMTTSAPEEVDPPCDTYDSVLTVSAWDEYAWRGTTYTAGGTYTEEGTMDAETGCLDSLFTLHLTIHTTDSDTYVATECDSIVYNGKKYTVSGNYLDTLYDAQGNRTIVALQLTIPHSSAEEVYAEACESYEWHEVVYTESGEYIDTLTNTAGCDSIVTLHLTIHPSYHITYPEEHVCNKYVWGDTLITTSGTYTRSFTSQYGCDSIETLTITVSQSSNMVVPVTAYDSYEWVNGMTYTKSILGPSIEMVNAAGCDSVVTLDLTIRHLQVKDTFTRSLCASELPYIWYGKTCTESGIYASDTILGEAENKIYMDTVHCVNLVVLPLGFGDTTAVACSSFEWHGTTYTESGDYPYATQTKMGCDSTVTLHLTIYTPTEGDTIAAACNSFVWYGDTYTQSGDYTHLLEGANAHGCDSTVTLHLTIFTPTVGDTVAAACNRFVWYGETYTQSGNYTHQLEGANMHGCDSTVTLHLTIYTPTDGDTAVVACERYTWYGETYTQSGNYTHLLEGANAHGCDSTITLHLTIYTPTDGDTAVVACERYTWYGDTYTQSGNYTYLLEGANAHGCDSTVTLHLTIEQDCYVYDTIYFCKGYNIEHEEIAGDGLIHRYMPYLYESPASWDEYLEGVVVSSEPTGAWVDLARAEANLYAHYVGALMPIQAIQWSAMAYGTTQYESLAVTSDPQWIGNGVLAMQLFFVCSETYTVNIQIGTQAMEAAEASKGAVKYMENGQIVIVRGGQKYSITGVKID